MRLKTFALTAALAVVGLPAFAGDSTVKFGSAECVADTSNCIIFFGPMSEEKLLAAGFSLTDLDDANSLVDLAELKYAPANTWFTPSYSLGS